MIQNNWHSISFDLALKELNSNRDKGLAAAEVKTRQKQYGKNGLPEARPLSGIILFLSQFKSPLVYILLLSGVITLAMREYSESAVIFFIVVINATIGYFQERKTAEILGALKKLIKIKALVVRNGEERIVPQEDLVPGDIILLSPGDKVPADARIIESQNLRVNESVLTGEWLAVAKQNNALLVKTPIADRNSMVYMGTVTEEGKTVAVVTATGLQTEIGKLASIVRTTRDEKTPYQRKIENFSKIIAIVVLLACLIIFIGGVLSGENPFDIFLTAVSVAVAAIPEGLPIAVTLVFAFGVRELLKKKGLVRRLVASEILGSTSVICTDKTGTLTKAKMELKGIYTGDGKFLDRINQTGGEQIGLKLDSSHALALKIALLRSEAFIENFEEPMEQWVMRGRPTDKALFLAATEAGLDKEDILKEERLIGELLFDPQYKYSASLHRLPDKYVAYIMGAPEKILSMCKFADGSGTTVGFDTQHEKTLKEKYSLFASEGFRVISVAYKVIPEIDAMELSKLSLEENDKAIIYEKILDGAVFAGFITLHDPIRQSTREAMRICRQAGMKPVIITGDHKFTAKAVAKELDFNIKEENILEGKDLDEMSDVELDKIVNRIHIYARSEPRHKIRIVSAWQRKGEVVAMTGDGINDAPALKKANIGVALGSGTDVAKEASDLVLLDDNFEIIIVAIEEGRKIIDNIRKIITYLLIGGFTEVLLIGMALLFRLPLPVLPSQILWKNVIEDTPPSFALTLEPKEKDIMDRSPEPVNFPILTGAMKFLIFAVGIFTDLMLFGIFMWLLNQSYPIEKIRTVMFAGLVFDSFFLIFSLRNLRKNIWQYNPFANSYVVVSTIIGLALLFFAIYSPFGHWLLRTVPIGLFEWSILIGFGVINMVLIELTKFYFVARKNV